MLFEKKKKLVTEYFPLPQETKKRRTFNNFYTFCSFVLEYEEKLVSKSNCTYVLGAELGACIVG